MESTQSKCLPSDNTFFFGNPFVRLYRAGNEIISSLTMELLKIFFLFGSVASILSFLLSGGTVVLSISLTITLGPLVVLLVVGVVVWKIFDMI